MVFLTKTDVFYLDSVWKRGNINFLDNGSQILDQNNTHMQKQNLIKIYLLSLEVLVVTRSPGKINTYKNIKAGKKRLK